MANQPETPSTPVAATIARLTPEERAKRYADLRKRTSLSPLWAEVRDPEMHLRWVRNDKNDNRDASSTNFMAGRTCSPAAR